LVLAAYVLSAYGFSALGPLGAARADEPERRQFTFSWQFEPGSGMRPRGGTTTGAHVAVATEPSAAWKALHEPGLDDLERDRRAILAMAGGFRTTFDFIETVGFTDDFSPARPYQSWGTEYIYVVEDEPTEIVLQHVMVMFVETDKGEVMGPFVQKHWRQDWRYEDRDLHVFTGNDRWERRRLSAVEAAGRWTQAVYQVDDSPRYEAVGTWIHSGNYSSWTSEETRRPLPRRESSVRSDYDVLIGTNRHTITPTGWVQEEENLKVALDDNGEPAADAPYLSRELGVNRYERTRDFDFSAGDAYWEATSKFWAEVREAWADVYADHDTFVFEETVDGTALFEPMFDYAARLEAGEPYDAREAREFIRSTLSDYVR
jgi:Family of unknown function (DUF6607)